MKKYFMMEPNVIIKGQSGNKITQYPISKIKQLAKDNNWLLFSGETLLDSNISGIYLTEGEGSTSLNANLNFLAYNGIKATANITINGSTTLNIKDINVFNNCIRIPLNNTGNLNGMYYNEYDNYARTIGSRNLKKQKFSARDTTTDYVDIVIVDSSKLIINYCFYQSTGGVSSVNINWIKYQLNVNDTENINKFKHSFTALQLTNSTSFSPLSTTWYNMSILNKGINNDSKIFSWKNNNSYPYYSTDTLTWNVIAWSYIDNRSNTIFVAGSKLFMIGGDYVSYSKDGINWKSSSLPNLGSNIPNWENLIYIDGCYFLLSNDSINQNRTSPMYVAVEADTLVWKQASLEKLNLDSFYYWYNISSWRYDSNAIPVMVYEDNNGQYHVVYASVNYFHDLQTFSQLPAISIPKPGERSATYFIVSGNKLYSATLYNDWNTSATDATGSIGSISLSGATSYNNLSTVNYEGGYYYIMPINQTHNRLWYSTSAGATWNYSTLPTTAKWYLPIHYTPPGTGTQVYYMFSEEGNTLTSTDGKTFTTYSNPPWGTSKISYAYEKNGKMFLVFQDKVALLQSIKSGSNTVLDIKVSNINAGDGLIYSHGLYCSNNAYSVDGITWKSKSGSTSYCWDGGWLNGNTKYLNFNGYYYSDAQKD